MAGYTPGDAYCLSSYAYNFYYCQNCPANSGRSIKFSEPDMKRLDNDEA